MGSDSPPAIRVCTRHKNSCPEKNRGLSFRGCDCPKYLLYPYEQRSIYAGTTQWQVAEKACQNILDSCYSEKCEAAELRAAAMAAVSSEIERVKTSLKSMNRVGSPITLENVRYGSFVLHVCHRRHPRSHIEDVITEAGYPIIRAASLDSAVAQLPLAAVIVISSCWGPQEKHRMAMELKEPSSSAGVSIVVFCLSAAPPRGYTITNDEDGNLICEPKS